MTELKTAVIVDAVRTPSGSTRRWSRMSSPAAPSRSGSSQATSRGTRRWRPDCPGPVGTGPVGTGPVGTGPAAADGGLVTADETVRAGTTAAGLAALRPSFRTEEMAARFPEIGWTITPGNSSPLTDGASAVLIMSEDAARRLGMRPRARFRAFSVIGDDPLLMLTGPIPATRKVLARAGLSLDDIDAYEVNEAFAPVPLAWAAEFGADPARLNPRGGAIALGHPLGSSGTRLLTTLLSHLEQTGGRYGLVAMCEAGGMANATIIERL